VVRYPQAAVLHLCIEELVEVRVEQMGAAERRTFRGRRSSDRDLDEAESVRRPAGVETRLMATR